MTPASASKNAAKTKAAPSTPKPLVEEFETIVISSDEEKPLDLSTNQKKGTGQVDAGETGERKIKKENPNFKAKHRVASKGTAPKKSAKTQEGKPVQAAKPIQAKPSTPAACETPPKMVPPPAAPPNLVPINDQNARAAKITRKNLAKLSQHQARQIKYAKDGPKQDRERMAGRLNQQMKVIILPNGGPGLVRKENIPWKPVHGEEKMSEQDIAKKRRKESG